MKDRVSTPKSGKVLAINEIKQGGKSSSTWRYGGGTFSPDQAARRSGGEIGGNNGRGLGQESGVSKALNRAEKKGQRRMSIDRTGNWDK